ncbi:hypothetical protein, partial [Kocuria rosea]|uniref:hypothetical protein n=1 Tax=Kocuria rosea TaxID=1275 RepID=UPI00164388C6
FTPPRFFPVLFFPLLLLAVLPFLLLPFALPLLINNPIPNTNLIHPEPPPSTHHIPPYHIHPHLLHSHTSYPYPVIHIPHMTSNVIFSA